MSTYRQVEITCDGCGTNLPAAVLHSIRARLLPAVRRQIVDGQFGKLTCTLCGTVTWVEVETVYLDTARSQYVGVALPTQAAGAELAASRSRHAAAFAQAITDGPPAAQALGGGLVHRLVFGIAGLREKLLLWDAGIDDRSAEAGKLAMMRELSRDPSQERWRVEAVLDGGHLMCRTAEGSIEVVPASYQPSPVTAVQVAPWLADDWLVDATLGLEVASQASAGLEFTTRVRS